VSTYLPTLKQLQYLVALKTHGHFGRAAESCFVTQSTLSAGIKELETLLGVQLVERDKRNVRLTTVGEDVAARARGLLAAATDLTEAASSAARPLAGLVRARSALTRVQVGEEERVSGAGRVDVALDGDGIDARRRVSRVVCRRATDGRHTTGES